MSLQQTQIQKNLKQVQQRIETACARFSRPPTSLRLVAVSKTHDLNSVIEAAAVGQQWFGENYVQELLQKSMQTGPKVRWSFIGTVQSNKIEKLASHADEIQTLTSVKHATKLQEALVGKKNNYPVFICVNAANESTKSGCRFDEVAQLRDHIEENCPLLDLQGIMAIPPLFPPSQEDEARRLYAQLRNLAEGVGKRELSLGMSQDLELAIECGSTVVRVGTDIFGTRMKG